jgi:hypothetical protein
MEFETKKQRNNYFRSVNTIINDGPAARPEWAKVPITFTEEDFKLKSANHNNAMVIEVNIAGWVIGKNLVDNGSSADILFFKTFEKMNLIQHMLHPPEYPLQGFRGKPINQGFGGKAAARNQEMPPDVFFEIIKEPSIKESKPRIVNVMETPDWRAEIMAYLRGHYKPQDELQEKRLKQRARGYAMVNEELYKSGVTEPWLRCITSEKGLELLKEIHSGFCGAHIGTRALAGKTIKQGFHWPTINIDAKALVR